MKIRNISTVEKTAEIFNVSIPTVERWLRLYLLSAHECKTGKPFLII